MKTPAAVTSSSHTLVLGRCDSEGRYFEERITFTPAANGKTVKVDVVRPSGSYSRAMPTGHARTMWTQWVAAHARRVVGDRNYKVLPNGRLGYSVVTSWYSDAGSAEDCCPPGYEYESHENYGAEDLSHDESIVAYVFRPVAAAKAA